MIKVIGEITGRSLWKFMEQIETIPQDMRIYISSQGGNIGYMLAMLDEIDEQKFTTYAAG